MSPYTLVTINMDRKIPWSAARQRGFLDVLKPLNADAICMQESMEFETPLMGPLGMIQASDHVNCPILINPDRFKLPAPAHLDLNVNMTGYGRKRYGSATLLEDRETSFRFSLASIHPSNTGEYPSATAAAAGRLVQFREAYKQLTDRGWTKVPHVILGDYNDRRPDLFPGLTDLLKEGGLTVGIDRGFAKGLRVVKAWRVPIPTRLTDHGKAVVFQLEPLPAPKPTTYLGPYRVDIADGLWCREWGNLPKLTRKLDKGFVVRYGVRIGEAKHPTEGDVRKWLITKSGNAISLRHLTEVK